MITVLTAAEHGDVFTSTITATSLINSTKKDAVKAKVTAD